VRRAVRVRLHGPVSGLQREATRRAYTVVLPAIDPDGVDPVVGIRVATARVDDRGIDDSDVASVRSGGWSARGRDGT
jgi:hypothetical protein